MNTRQLLSGHMEGHGASTAKDAFQTPRAPIPPSLPRSHLVQSHRTCPVTWVPRSARGWSPAVNVEGTGARGGGSRPAGVCGNEDPRASMSESVRPHSTHVCYRLPLLPAHTKLQRVGEERDDSRRCTEAVPAPTAPQIKPQLRAHGHGHRRLPRRPPEWPRC